MASRPRGYGLTRELDDKIKEKYDDEQEKALIKWICAWTNEQEPEVGPENFQQWLADGQILCKLINKIKYPGVTCVPKNTQNKTGGMKSILENENIEKFLNAAEKIGVPRLDLFQTVNLKEGRNMASVQLCLNSLGSVLLTKKIEGPKIGVKHATENKREFDADTQRAGQNIIGLQMGTNQVASQKGMTGYGLGRQIIHKTQ